MNLQPLWPVIVDDYCRDHDSQLPCSKCAADASFDARMADMHRWEHLAEMTDQMVLGSPEDRKSLSEWSAYCRKRAAMLNGELMAEANAEEFR